MSDINTNQETWYKRHLDSTSHVYAAFGRFISQYATVEETIHILFRQCTGLHDNAARAISSGMRLIDLIQRIRRLNKANKKPAITQDALEMLFEQFSLIHNLRDILVHRRSVFWGDEIISMNHMTSKSLDDSEKLTAHFKDIDNATTDLCVIYIKLFNLMDPANPTYQKMIQEKRLESYTWLYKRLLPEKSNQSPSNSQ